MAKTPRDVPPTFDCHAGCTARARLPPSRRHPARPRAASRRSSATGTRPTAPPPPTGRRPEATSPRPRSRRPGSSPRGPAIPKSARPFPRLAGDRDGPAGAESAFPRFPEAGEVLAGFRLLAELGRGAEGRVFLASQPELSDRPVVLKVTPLRGGEHRSLARLQHTHVVPLLSVQDLGRRGLRLLCLPYQGGVSLSWIWDELADTADARAARPRLRRGPRPRGPLAGEADPGPFGGPRPRLPGGRVLRAAICWIAFCLAEALQHAHDRDLVHLDVKPANVLIAADGMPLLLDFHLARAPMRRRVGAVDARRHARLHGTRAARRPWTRCAASGRCPRRSTAGADIYGLGMLLYEGLTGTIDAPASGVAPRDPPGQPAGERRARRRRRALPGARPRPVAIPTRRRSPTTCAGTSTTSPCGGCRTAACRSAGGGGAGDARSPWRGRGPWPRRPWGSPWRAPPPGSGRGSRLADAEDELAQGRRHLEAAAPVDAERSLRHGLELLEAGIVPGLPGPGAGRLRRALADELGRAHRARQADRLHDLADRARFLDAAGLPDVATARRLERGLARGLEGAGPDRGPARRGADARSRERIRVDLLDLAILWADLRVELADDAGRDDARRDAIRALDEAEADWGPSPVLSARASIARPGPGGRDRSPRGCGRDRDAVGTAPRTAWEWYALGRSLLRSARSTTPRRPSTAPSSCDPGASGPSSPAASAPCVAAASPRPSTPSAPRSPSPPRARLLPQPRPRLRRPRRPRAGPPRPRTRPTPRPGIDPGRAPRRIGPKAGGSFPLNRPRGSKGRRMMSGRIAAGVGRVGGGGPPRRARPLRRLPPPATPWYPRRGATRRRAWPSLSHERGE